MMSVASLASRLTRRELGRGQGEGTEGGVGRGQGRGQGEEQGGEIKRGDRGDRVKQGGGDKGGGRMSTHTHKKTPINTQDLPDCFLGDDLCLWVDFLGIRFESLDFLLKLTDILLDLHGTLIQ